MSILLGEQAVRIDQSDYPEDITTGGMGPCTGVIIFNRTTGVSYGVHLVAPHEEDASELARMLTDASNEFSDCSDVDICVSGCCEEKPSRKHVRIRQYVENAVKGAFPKNAKIDFQWPSIGTNCVDMTLDPETGKFFVHSW